MKRQNIDFEGLVNCRDLGGLETEASGVTRSGVLFRSETPQVMTKADVTRARSELGIGCVIDLRGETPRESKQAGSGPVAEGGRGVVMDFLELAGGMDKVDPSPHGILVDLLQCGGNPLRIFLEHFVSTDAAVLVHCHTGKDRTGFAAALTLALVGVRDDEIIADYELSIPAFLPMMENLEAKGLGLPDNVPAFARHQPSSVGIKAMLSHLRSNWTSPEAWALEHGISHELIEKTQARLVG